MVLGCVRYGTGVVRHADRKGSPVVGVRSNEACHQSRRTAAAPAHVIAIDGMRRHPLWFVVSRGASPTLTHTWRTVPPGNCATQRRPHPFPRYQGAHRVPYEVAFGTSIKKKVTTVQHEFFGSRPRAEYTLAGQDR